MCFQGAPWASEVSLKCPSLCLSGPFLCLFGVMLCPLHFTKNVGDTKMTPKRHKEGPERHREGPKRHCTGPGGLMRPPEAP